MSESPGGRRLTPAQSLLIVVVSALVLLFVVLLVGRMTSNGQPSADASPSPSSAASEEATTPQEPTAPEEPTSEVSADALPEEGEPDYFASPSGNIVCELTTDSADCVISSFNYEPADAADCADDAAGSHLRVEAAGASMPCEPLVVAGDVPTLDYGDSTTAHGYTCDSEESGVTCRHDETGYGFSVARAGYELF